jgi:hypothetical protein
LTAPCDTNGAQPVVTLRPREVLLPASGPEGDRKHRKANKTTATATAKRGNVTVRIPFANQPGTSHENCTAILVRVHHRLAIPRSTRTMRSDKPRKTVGAHTGTGDGASS